MTQVAFITGAASGIGRALAEQLGNAGARLWLADRDPKVAEVAEILCKQGVDAYGVELDVTDRDAMADAVEACIRQHGGVDLMVNNAGIGIAAEVRDTPMADWRRIVDVNLFGVINGVEAVYPHMIERGRGHIVNVASVAGLVPLPGEAAYVASKHAVVGFSQTLRAEAAGLGVRVSTVCPGVVKTPIYDSSRVVGFDKDRVMALWPKGITADACAARILRGVRRNEAMVLITPTAHVLWHMHRLAPRLFIKAAQGYIGYLRRGRAA